MNVLAVLSAVVWVPVASQLFPQTGSVEFPSRFGTSFSLPESGSMFDPPAFLSGQSSSLTRGDTQRPFPPLQPPPNFTPTNAGNGNGGDQKDHTYADGTMGGDYPTHKAAQQKEQQQQQLLQQGGGPNPGLTSGQPRSQFSKNPPTQQSHTYAEGTMGGDYPAHKAAQQKEQQQQLLQQRGGPNPGLTSGQPRSQFSKNPPTQQTHTYAEGTMGGDYPAHKAAQQKEQQQQLQQQQQQPTVQFGGNFPPQFQVPPGGKGPSQGFPSSNQGQHTYADGKTGGDYPSTMAAQQRGNAAGEASGGTHPSQLANHQFTVPASSNNVPFSTQRFSPVQAPAGNFGRRSVFPPVQVPGNNPAFLGSLPRGSNPKTSPLSQSFPPQGVPQGGSNSGQHTYHDGTTGENYPKHKAKQQTGGRPFTGVPHTFPGGGVRDTGTGTSFLPSSHLSPPGGAQCFRYQDLAASYKLSDVDSDYPTDSIRSEIISNPHLLPMLGYESLPESKDSGSFLGDFGDSFGLSSSFSSLGRPSKIKANKVSNVKYFPSNFDKNTLGQAMAPLDTACPSQSFLLRALTINGQRCSVVNADFQALTFAKCLRRDCSGQCRRGGRGGVSACVERYSWVTVMVHCRQWQRGQRINAVRVYLPQGCSCNRYQC